jgi:hypothetical protein
MSISRNIFQFYVYFLCAPHSIKTDSVHDSCLGFVNSALATGVALSSTDDAVSP